jgi:hypothetical protein
MLPLILFKIGVMIFNDFTVIRKDTKDIKGTKAVQ